MSNNSKNQSVAGVPEGEKKRTRWVTAVRMGPGAYVGLLCSLLLASGYLELWAPIGLSGPAGIAWVTLLVAATLWMTEAIPLHATGLVVLLLNLAWLMPALDRHGIEVSQDAFLSPFFSDIILLFLGGFVLSAALHARGLDLRVARALLGRTAHSTRLSIGAILVTTAALSMWLSNTATAAMMLALCGPIAARLPDRLGKALILAVPLGANIGGLGTPIGTPPNAIALEYLSKLGKNISFIEWLAIGLPGVGVLLVIAYFALMRMFPGEDQPLPLEADASELEGDEAAPSLVTGGAPALPKRLTPHSWLTIHVTLLTVLGWMTGSIHGMSPGTVALFAIVTLVASGVIALQDFRGLPWDVLMLMGGGLTLGVAIDKSGLSSWLVELIPLSADPKLLVIAFAVMACAMSSLMSNTATANLLMPVIIGLSGADVGALLLTSAFACSLAMPLPVSTPPNAIAFASGQLSTKDLLRPGLLVTVLGLALALTTGLWWWGIVLR